MKNRMLLVAVATSVLGVSLLALAGPDSKPPASVLPEFAGKIVMVYCSTELKYPAHVVDKPHFQSVGNRLFLAGIGADTKREDDWKIGLNTNIAWDSVTSYHVFTPEEFAEFLTETSEAK